jgi:hypothetical protein
MESGGNHGHWQGQGGWAYDPLNFQKKGQKLIRILSIDTTRAMQKPNHSATTLLCGIVGEGMY